jgi:hypothetical protein
VPRGSVGSGSAWSFVRREDMASRDVARRRMENVPEGVISVRVAESARFRPTRDLRELSEARLAVPRAARVRPTPGDSVIELQRDNQTQVGVGPLTPNGRRGHNEDSRNDEAAGDAQSRAGARAEPRHPTDVRSPGRSERVVREPNAAAAAEARPGSTSPASTNRDGARSRDRAQDTERDVLGRLFRPLSDPGKAQGGDNNRSGNEDRARSRSGGAPPEQTQTRARPRENGYNRPPESSPPPRNEPRTSSPRSEPRSEPRTQAPAPRSEPRSEPRAQAPRSEPRTQAPRAEPRNSSPPPRASAPPPRSAPASNSGGGAVARPRNERP